VTRAPVLARSYREAAASIERLALNAVERAAREYARHSHGNIGNQTRYRAREEARDKLLDALAELDTVRGS